MWVTSYRSRPALLGQAEPRIPASAAAAPSRGLERHSPAGSSHAPRVRPPRPGLGAPTFVAGVEALRTDRVVTDEAQGESGGRADDGGWQLKACEPERQRGTI